MIRVWSDNVPAGALDRLGPHGATFAYNPELDVDRAVSVTMPVRVQSYDTARSLTPIFEMNLPEGSLKERLSRQFAKATGEFDDFDLLSVVGRTQIGRVRFSGLGHELSEDVPFQAIDEILRARRDGELFDYLLNQFAVHSGISGVQPKVLIRATREPGHVSRQLQMPSVQSSTHIVKLWDETEFPHLAANEYFCMTVAKELGMQVPSFQLSDDGGALVVERFDRQGERYLGFEDFCVLNGFATAQKYKGSYETRLFKRVKDFLAPSEWVRGTENLFRLFVLNCAIRNGDAHLKNFGIVYERVNGPAALAPVYDLVTTVAYLPEDQLALTLDESTRWPDRKSLIRLGHTRADLTLERIEEILTMTADVLAAVRPRMRTYFDHWHPDMGQRIEAAWELGIRGSLGR